VARHEALQLGLRRKDAAGSLLAASEPVSGLLGSVAALLSVRPGFEAAIAGALGNAADAVAVDDAATAVRAMSLLRSDDLGRAAFLIGEDSGPDPVWPELPTGAVYAVGVVECPRRWRRHCTASSTGWRWSRTSTLRGSWSTTSPS
jgi:chromosome segregation protein